MIGFSLVFHIFALRFKYVRKNYSNMAHPKHFISGLGLITIMAFSFTSFVNKSDKKPIVTDSNTVNKTLYVEDFDQFKSHDDLVAYFGEKEVVKSEKYILEGTVKVLISTVFPESNHPLTVYWETEQNAYKNIQFVEVSKMVYDKDFNMRITEDNYWKFKNGLKIGMTIQELQKLNGGVFKFLGVAWDNGGTVLSENKTFDNYRMTLDYVVKANGKRPKSYKKIMGDMDLTSDNKIAKRLPLRLVTIKYYFNTK